MLAFVPFIQSIVQTLIKISSRALRHLYSLLLLILSLRIWLIIVVRIVETALVKVRCSSLQWILDHAHSDVIVTNFSIQVAFFVKSVKSLSSKRLGGLQWRPILHVQLLFLAALFNRITNWIKYFLIIDSILWLQNRFLRKLCTSSTRRWECVYILSVTALRSQNFGRDCLMCYRSWRFLVDTSSLIGTLENGRMPNWLLDEFIIFWVWFDLSVALLVIILIRYSIN